MNFKYLRLVALTLLLTGCVQGGSLSEVAKNMEKEAPGRLKIAISECVDATIERRKPTAKAIKESGLWIRSSRKKNNWCEVELGGFASIMRKSIHIIDDVAKSKGFEKIALTDPKRKSVHYQKGEGFLVFFMSHKIGTTSWKLSVIHSEKSA